MMQAAPREGLRNSHPKPNAAYVSSRNGDYGVGAGTEC